ncbi:short-chain dehydrogenase/reductase family 16C member 6-like [Suncus etruscus]|uniref:short-chain dehydrogenase/reductase family 16C member 6-like n=1 Tax=Suncus etruscus TaxID=109475 RepID=UPI0021106E14|nr:short-chain dehydrogenase/reductase family 16C member 6-like [Suncus etruscus]
MNVIVDSAELLGKLVYYLLEASFYSVIPKKKKDVTGEIVLITGAGSGLGRLMAILFAKLGAILVLWDIDQEGNMETRRLIEAKGPSKVFAYTCDCSNRQEVYRIADQVKKEVGDVTILINNAGVVTGKLFLDIPDHMVEKNFSVNAISHFWTYKAFLPAMMKANHGHLVCISSVAGTVGTSTLSDYSASKFAAFGFAESIFLELALLLKKNIKTTIVCPFFIESDMFNGCVSKYPMVLPLLKQDYVAERIVNGILEEQVYLIIPKFMSFALFLKQALPTKMTIALSKFFGMDICMASFKGRENTNQVQMKTEKITPANSTSIQS